MPRVRNYLEGQSFTASASFLDEDFEAAAPDTVRYRIDCLTTRRVVRDWTVLTPAASIDIAVEPDDNAIINERNSTERKQLVLQTNYDTASQGVWSTEWVVKNLQGVT